MLLFELMNATEKMYNDVISDAGIPWDELRGAAVFVTGATGFIGSNIVRVLSAADKRLGLGLKLYGHGRALDKGAVLAQDCGMVFIYGDIRGKIPGASLPGSVDLIFHCAAVTKSADMHAHPDEVLDIMVRGTCNALDIAIEKHCKSFVYLSSMEVYGQADVREVSEHDLGTPDLSDPRSCYPHGKRQSEELCLRYASEYGLNVKIARLAMTFGAGSAIGAGADTRGDTRGDTRADAQKDMRVPYQFARSALAGEAIELHTQGRSIANCCHTSDVIRGLLLIALKGGAGEVYNVSNPETAMSIYEMAQTAAVTISRCTGKDRVDVVIKIPDDIDKRGYAPDANYRLNADKLKALGWSPMYGLEDMFRDLAGCG